MLEYNKEYDSYSLKEDDYLTYQEVMDKFEEIDDNKMRVYCKSAFEAETIAQEIFEHYNILYYDIETFGRLLVIYHTSDRERNWSGEHIQWESVDVNHKDVIPFEHFLSDLGVFFRESDEESVYDEWGDGGIVYEIWCDRDSIASKKIDQWVCNSL